MFTQYMFTRRFKSWRVRAFSYTFSQSAYTYVTDNSYITVLDPYSEVGANLVPPNGVPGTKTVPSSCGANTPKSG